MDNSISGIAISHAAVAISSFFLFHIYISFTAIHSVSISQPGLQTGARTMT